MKYIVIKKRKIEIKILSSFKDRVKSIRLVLDTINNGYYFPNKKGINIILDGVFSHTGADSKYFNKFGNYEMKIIKYFIVI